MDQSARKYYVFFKDLLIKKAGELFSSPASPQSFSVHLQPDQGTISYPLATELPTGAVITRNRDAVKFLITSAAGNKIYNQAGVERLNIVASLQRITDAPRDGFGRSIAQEATLIYPEIPLAFVRKSLSSDSNQDRLKQKVRVEFLTAASFAILPGDLLTTPVTSYTVVSVIENVQGVLAISCES